MTNFFVIFGAAVRPDGTPSGTLHRRVEGALVTATAATGAVLESDIFITSGAKGKYGAAEAVVMERLLIAQGVPTDRIIRDEKSRDTLESVINCGRILARHATGDDKVHVCTSLYHMPRCLWLLRLTGVTARSGTVVPDRPWISRSKLTYHYAREVLAFAWDTLVIAVRLVTDNSLRVRLRSG